MLYHVTNSLMRMQVLYGVIPNIYGKGDLAKVTSKISLDILLFKHFYL